MPFNQQMNFPNELRLKTTSKGIRLVRQPVKEIKSLYIKTHTVNNVSLKPDLNPLADVEADLLDVSFELELGSASGFSLSLHGVEINYKADTKTLNCLDKTAELVAENNRVNLRFLLDKTSIELFADDGETCMSFCFLPENSNLKLSNPDGKANLKVLNVHELKSAW